MIDDAGELVLVVSVPILVAVSLAAVFGYGTLAAVVSIVGFVGVVPLVAVFGDRVLDAADAGEGTERSEPAADEGGESSGPVEELRERYVEGELTEPEFERKLERLLEDEDLDAAARERELE